MASARLIITAVVLEGRTQAEVAAAYGVSKSWVSKLVARYRIEGQAASEPTPASGCEIDSTSKDIATAITAALDVPRTTAPKRSPNP